MILSPKCRIRCFSSQNTFAGCCHRNSTHSTTNVFFSQAACSAWRSRRQNCRSSRRREGFYPEKELQGQSGAVNHCSARVSEQLWTCTTERKNPPDDTHPSTHTHPRSQELRGLGSISRATSNEKPSKEERGNHCPSFPSLLLQIGALQLKWHVFIPSCKRQTASFCPETWSVQPSHDNVKPCSINADSRQKIPVTIHPSIYQCFLSPS